MYRNARPLELALYQYYFEEGEKQQVISILSTFQNTDGGFAHGLEPDAWNVHSNPIHTWYATRIIHDLDLRKDHPMVKEVLRFLEQTPHQFNGHYPFVIKSNDEYPHAPWFSYNDRGYDDYNPTASLVGFILRYGQHSSNLFKQAMMTATEAIDHILSKGCHEMHELNCYMELAEYIESSQLQHLFRYKGFIEAIEKCVHHLIEKDVEMWVDYTCTPLTLIKSPKSPFYKDFQSLIDIELEQIKNMPWRIKWSWEDYPEAFTVAKQWWLGILTIKNLKLLEAFSKM
jgi:hypothetical protein